MAVGVQQLQVVDTCHDHLDCARSDGGCARVALQSQRACPHTTHRPSCSFQRYSIRPRPARVWVSFQANRCFQVQFPLRIVGVGCTPDLHPPQDLAPPLLSSTGSARALPCAVTDHAREHPVPAAVSLEVFLLDPLPALLAMASSTPSHQLPEDPVIHCLEGAFTHRITVIHGPALDLLIQTPDHVSRRHAARVVDRFLDLGQERLDVSLRRLDQDLAIAVTSASFCPRKSKPSSICVILVFSWESSRPRFRQEVFHERLDFIFRRSSFDVPVIMKSSA